MSLRRPLLALSLLLAVLSMEAHARPAPPVAPPVVVAVVGESGVNVLHQEFATPDGRSVELPAAIRRQVVRVRLPRGGDFESRAAALRKGPLGSPKPGTLYYVEGTRLLVYNHGTRAPEELLSDFHGTAVASGVGGRTVGGAPRALVVAVIGDPTPSWDWVAAQSWVELATTSVFEVLPGGVQCGGVDGVSSFRATGRLPFIAAGNSVTDTTVLSPGGHPSAVRVGGVHADGSTAIPDSGRAYDLAELYTSRYATAEGADTYAVASGTSGSSPRVAGHAAEVLRRVRQAVADAGGGVRGGALVVARSRRPAAGPLADGRLTSEELLHVLLATSRPHEPARPGRYAQEGYGWFDGTAAAAAVDVLLGRAAAPARAQDDQERQVALVARSAVYASRGCAAGS